jgi:AraC family transcriptional regulator
MTTSDVKHPSRSFTATRIFYPAGDYCHPPAGLLQLRLVRRGSSYAHIDLGRGLRHVFTRPGDLLLSLPKSSTRFKIDDGRALTLLQVTPELTETALKRSGAVLDDLAPLTERPFRDSLIAEICRRMEGTDSFDGPLGLRALELVIGLLFFRARNYSARTQGRVLSERRLAEIFRYIDDHIAEEITVERLAGIAGMPVRQFSAAFREATALPVYQHVLRRRVERAVELLQTTDLPLADIAQRTGFTHQPHMTRVLKRLKGLTPNQLRKKR